MALFFLNQLLNQHIFFFDHSFIERNFFHRKPAIFFQGVKLILNRRSAIIVGISDDIKSGIFIKVLAGLASGYAATVGAQYTNQLSDAVSAELLSTHEILHTLGADDTKDCSNCLMNTDGPRSSWTNFMNDDEILKVLETTVGTWTKIWDDLNKTTKGKFLKIKFKRSQNANESLDEEVKLGKVIIK